MNSTVNKEVHIKIMGRIYTVRCPIDLISDLENCAAFLNTKIVELQEKNKVANTPEMLAIIVALNLTHEHLIQQKEKHHFTDFIRDRLQKLQLKIAETLA